MVQSQKELVSARAQGNLREVSPRDVSPEHTQPPHSRHVHVGPSGSEQVHGGLCFHLLLSTPTLSFQAGLLSSTQYCNMLYCTLQMHL